MRCRKIGFLDKLPWSKKDDEDPFADAPQGSTNQDYSQDPFSQNNFQNSQNSFSQDPFSQNNLQNSSSNDMSSQNFSDPMNSPIQNTREQSYPEDEHRSRDMELVLAKLDAIKAELDSVHQRIRKIEQSTDSHTTKKYNW